MGWDDGVAVGEDGEISASHIDCGVPTSYFGLFSVKIDILLEGNLSGEKLVWAK